MESNTGSWVISLNENDWSIWKAKMKDFLYCKGLYAPIEDDKAKLTGTSDDDWKKLNQKTIDIIRQWLDDSVFHHVSNEVLAQFLWKKLEDLYERRTVGNKAFFIRKLMNLKFKERGFIVEQLNKMQSIMNQLTSMKMVLEDKLQALLLFSSLPDS